MTEYFLQKFWDSEDKQFANAFERIRRLEDGPIRVCAVGGGPGSDLFGLSLFASRNLSKAVRIKGKVLDQYKEWNDLASKMLQMFVRKLPHVALADIQHSSFNIYQGLSDSCKEDISDADIVTMVKFMSALEQGKVFGKFSALLKSMRSGSLLLFIENSGGGYRETMEYLAASENFVQLNSVTRHLFELNDSGYLEMMLSSNINIQPQRASKVTASLWLKRGTPCRRSSTNRAQSLKATEPKEVKSQPFPKPARSFRTEASLYSPLFRDEISTKLAVENKLINEEKVPPDTRNDIQSPPPPSSRTKEITSFSSPPQQELISSPCTQEIISSTSAPSIEKKALHSFSGEEPKPSTIPNKEEKSYPTTQVLIQEQVSSTSSSSIDEKASDSPFLREEPNALPTSPTYNLNGSALNQSNYTAISHSELNKNGTLSSTDSPIIIANGVAPSPKASSFSIDTASQLDRIFKEPKYNVVKKQSRSKETHLITKIKFRHLILIACMFWLIEYFRSLAMRMLLYFT